MSYARFEAQLKSAINENKNPVSKASDILKQKKRPAYFNKGWKLSFIFHGAVALIFAVSSVINYFVKDEAKKDFYAKQSNKQSIRVDIVALPSMRIFELQKMDLSGELEVADEKLKPSKDAMILPKKDSKKKSAKKTDESAQSKAKDRIAQLRNKLKLSQKRKQLINKLKKDIGKGSASDRPVVGGNKLSSGSFATGDIATDHASYLDRLKSHIKNNWQSAAPGWMLASDSFKAQILIRISPQGALLEHKVIRSSGDAEFDASAKRAIELSEPFPPPPNKSRIVLMEDGFICGVPE